MSASGGGKGGGGKTRNRGSANSGPGKPHDKLSSTSATSTADSNSHTSKSTTLPGQVDKNTRQNSNEGGAKLGGDTLHKIVPTAEQLRIAQMISDPKKEDPDLLEKISKLVEVTGRSADSVTIALHDCNNDLERATILLLDGEGEGDWEVSGKKKKGRLNAKAGQESGESELGQSAGRERDREPQGDRDRSRSARGPPRMRGRGRGKENKERDDWGEGVDTSSDFTGARGERGGRGGRGGRMMNGRGRGGAGGGRGRGYGGRGGGPGRPPRNASQTEDSWDTPTDQEPIKMDNWGEDFPTTEDWDNEEYTGSLADTKVFTPSSQVAPPSSADPSSAAAVAGGAPNAPPGLLNGEIPTADVVANTPPSGSGHVLYSAVATNQANAPVPASTTAVSNNVPAGTPLDLSMLLQKEPTNMKGYMSQYSQPSTASGYMSYNSVAGGVPSQAGSAAAAAAAAARARPQRPKVAPPSKIPSSAVEMPNDDAVNQLDLKFGSLDFGVGVESAGFELTPLQQHQQQQSVAAQQQQQVQSQASSNSGMLGSEAISGGLGVSNTGANLGGAGDYGNKGTSSLGSTSAMSKAGDSSSTSGLGGNTGGYGSSQQTSASASYPYQGPKSSYGTGYNAYGQGYNNTSNSGTGSGYGSSHHQQQQQQQSTPTSTPYGSSSYGYGSSGGNNNANTAPSNAYPSSGVYNPAAGVPSGKKDVPSSVAGGQGSNQGPSGYDSNAGGSNVPSTTLSMQALGLSSSNVPTRSGANSSTGPSSKVMPVVSSSGTVLSALQPPSVAPTSQPGLPAGTLLGTQYIMGGPGPGMPFYPANLQQPMYSLEDMQLFQQRYPHLSNAEVAAAYYGMGYQSPTSLTAAATQGTRESSIASQGLASMAYDNKFARPDNNSPVPTSLSQSAAAQSHQAAYLSAAAAAAAAAPLPPAYAYFYGGGVVPGGFQYGPAPTALYPVSAPSSAQGQGHVQTPSGHMGAGQYGKGPGAPSQQQTPNTGVGSSGVSAYNYASTYEALANSDFKSMYGGGSVGVGSGGGASGVVPNKVGSSGGPGSGAADLGSVYGKAAPHSQLSKVSYDKPGFHTGTPPPFNLAAPGSGTGPGAYTQMFIPTLAPHQSHHSQLMHAQLHQDSGAGGQRSAGGGQGGAKTGPKGAYAASYWGTN